MWPGNPRSRPVPLTMGFWVVDPGWFRAGSTGLGRRWLYLHSSLYIGFPCYISVEVFLYLCIEPRLMLIQSFELCITNFVWES